MGEARSTPVIRAVKDLAAAPHLDTVIIDAPPGVACPAVEALRGADFAVLVTEPTPFGLHDLKLAVETARQMDIPCGVVVNRAGIGDSRVNDFCAAEGVPILLEIPDNRRIAEACSRGEVFAATDAAFAADLRDLAGRSPGPDCRESDFSRELSGEGGDAVNGSDSSFVPKQLVVLSGKGGTGKTSIVAALAALVHRQGAGRLRCRRRRSPSGARSAAPKHREPFMSGKEAHIEPERCSACGECMEHCRFDAIGLAGSNGGRLVYAVDPLACEGCGLCARVCTCNAVEMLEPERGEWFVSDTRHGPLVHARLNIGGENSGKLVTLVRNQALALAQETGAGLVLVDGPPGIGCPVIASVTGADLVLAVTEPTVSGAHDLERAADLVQGFGLPLAVCINKIDLNPDMAERIRELCATRGFPVVGELSYDTAVVRAQVEGKSIVEYGGSPVADQIREMWKILDSMLEEERRHRDGLFAAGQ